MKKKRGLIGMSALVLGLLGAGGTTSTADAHLVTQWDVMNGVQHREANSAVRYLVDRYGQDWKEDLKEQKHWSLDRDAKGGDHRSPQISEWISKSKWNLSPVTSGGYDQGQADHKIQR